MPSEDLTLELEANGSRKKTHTFLATGDTVRTRYTEVFDKLGLPSEILVERLSSKSDHNKLIVYFGPKQAKVTITVRGKTASGSLPYPAGSLRDSGAFWFIRDHPNIGATTHFIFYDIRDAKWKQDSKTYSGDKVVDYHRRSIKIHVIKHAGYIEWVDDNGLTFRLANEKGETTFQRE